MNPKNGETVLMVINDDGIRLSAVLEKPEDSECRRIVIVLHGFSSAKDRLHTIQAAEAMREAGFATLRFDLYGHGESGGEFRKHTLFKWIGNTMTVIDAVREMGYTELWLSGHSQGGLVAALVAGMEPDRIRGADVMGRAEAKGELYPGGTDDPGGGRCGPLQGAGADPAGGRG